MKIGRENLVVQIQLGDERTLEYLVKEHGERLNSIIRKHLFTLPNLQQECLVDTIVTIWNQIDSFDSCNDFENWIGSVARYRCLDFLRYHQKEATIAWLIEKEIAEEKEVMVSCLEPEEQELFYRFYVGEVIEQNAENQFYTAFRSMYELLNRVDTDICEYEQEELLQSEKEQVLRKIQSQRKNKRRGSSLLRFMDALQGRVQRRQILYQGVE